MCTDPKVRIAIIGAPRAGKTTLALELGSTMGAPVLHTDDWMALGWSAASVEVVHALATHVDLVLEGVAVVRGLRKALRLTTRAPVERCIVLERPRLALSRGQLAMARGCATVLQGIEPELARRGVTLERL
jgi:hypothetical protein